MTEKGRRGNPAEGVKADIAGSVEIAKWAENYFENPAVAQSFVDQGIAPIADSLPQMIHYTDFGGGEGFLANHVKNALEANGRHEVDACVADGNPKSLVKAEQLGLIALPCELTACPLPEASQDIITARSILHYNDAEEQQAILRRIHASLKPGGYFVHQIGSGSAESGALRSNIVNISDLQRAGKYEWVSLDEYLAWMKTIGFEQNEVVGEAPKTRWSVASMFDRYNLAALKEATVKSDSAAILEIEQRRIAYYEAAQKLLTQAREGANDEQLAIEASSDGDIIIRSPMPIVRSRKST